MKLRKIISSFLALAILSAFLMVNGGMILVSHACSMSNKTTLKTVTLLNPSLKIDQCCGSQNPVEGNNNLNPASCCKYKIEQFKLNSFVTARISSFSAIAFHFPPHINDILPPSSYKTGIPADIFDKHGGRFIITSNCQLIS